MPNEKNLVKRLKVFENYLEHKLLANKAFKNNLLNLMNQKIDERLKLEREKTKNNDVIRIITYQIDSLTSIASDYEGKIGKYKEIKDQLYTIFPEIKPKK